jgi:hypothetical protein
MFACEIVYDCVESTGLIGTKVIIDSVAISNIPTKIAVENWTDLRSFLWVAALLIGGGAETGNSSTGVPHLRQNLASSSS